MEATHRGSENILSKAYDDLPQTRKYITAFLRKLGVKDITILYVTMARMPGEKAHSIQIARMCSALQAEGVNVILAVPRRGSDLTRKSPIKQVMEFYGLKTGFRLIRFFVPDILRGGGKKEYLNWFLMCLVHVLQVLCVSFVLKLSRKKLYLFIREPLILVILYVLSPAHLFKYIYEVHGPQKTVGMISNLYWAALRKADRIITITDVLKRHVHLALGEIANEKVITIHDAVDENLYLMLGDRDNVPKLPSGKKIVMYVGQLYPWRNPEFLVNVVSNIKREDVLLVVVGGNEVDIKRLSNYSKLRGVDGRIFFTGYIKPRLVPNLLEKADVLIYHGSRRWSSPLKLFEYMLARKPIAASGDPGVREVLIHGKNGFLFEPSNPVDAAEKIETLLRETELSSRIAEEAYKTAKDNFTYRTRARKILQILKAAEK